MCSINRIVYSWFRWVSKIAIRTKRCHILFHSSYSHCKNATSSLKCLLLIQSTYLPTWWGKGSLSADDPLLPSLYLPFRCACGWRFFYLSKANRQPIASIYPLCSILTCCKKTLLEKQPKYSKLPGRLEGCHSLVSQYKILCLCFNADFWTSFT